MALGILILPILKPPTRPMANIDNRTGNLPLPALLHCLRKEKKTHTHWCTNINKHAAQISLHNPGNKALLQFRYRGEEKWLADPRPRSPSLRRHARSTYTDVHQPPPRFPITIT